MYVVTNNKKILLEEYNSFFKKFKGFMLTKNINKGIFFKKCNSIHTFFMLDKIDVVMINKNLKVLYIYKNLNKNRIIFPKRKVYYTIELPKNTIGDNIKVIN